MKFDKRKKRIIGESGSLAIAPNDEVAEKFLMLVEGECEGLGPIAAAKKYGYSKQRYFQIRKVFQTQGATGLVSQRRGPKTHYRRTGELVRQVIRHRFLDPQASADVIAQKLRQCGFPISVRSVVRVFNDYGLQKKTLSMSADDESADD